MVYLLLISQKIQNQTLIDLYKQTSKFPVKFKSDEKSVLLYWKKYWLIKTMLVVSFKTSLFMCTW